MKINYGKFLIIIFSVAMMFFVVYLSIELINESTKPKFLDIDYKSKSNEISAYGSLVGGILSFLSILFVLYNVLEVRGQIRRDKLDKKQEDINKSLNLLKLVDTIMIGTTSEVKSQGERMKEFYEAEIANPAVMNELKWNSNRNFGRLVNMNMDELFNAFETLSRSENWNKTLLNIFNLNDYYNDTFVDLKDKNRSHYKRKAADYTAIGGELEKLDIACSKFLDAYDGRFPSGSIEVMWMNSIKKFLSEFRTHLIEKKEGNSYPDFGYIRVTILKSFLENTKELVERSGYLIHGLEDICEQAILLRSSLELAELYSVQYGNEIKRQYENNFADSSETFLLYKNLQTEIKSIISND